MLGLKDTTWWSSWYQYQNAKRKIAKQIHKGHVQVLKRKDELKMLRDAKTKIKSLENFMRQSSITPPVLETRHHGRKPKRRLCKRNWYFGVFRRTDD